MLNPSAGSPTATLSANPVTASEFASPATLPLVTFWSSAPSPAVATALAAGAATAFQRLVTLQQAGVAPRVRVVGQVVQNATPGKLTGHKSKSLSDYGPLGRASRRLRVVPHPGESASAGRRARTQT